ncbi:MAG: D-alanyl-D-alanine carboxypeptidase precursor [Syntrophorhabdus sp. PtaU1.Bin058]|nr:MAG: D-alanyl-D-alanine carboxypeptidase precursor [Syntrophorhabdus sp. PtaU1.Bin058]
MSKIRIIGMVCLCLILVAVFTAGKAVSRENPYESAITTARSEIWKAINSGKCGSATAAIMVDGKIIYTEGFGMANREKSIPVNISTLFNIGSISKVYVATAIMLLVDDGKVSLDRPVTDYLPEFRMADDRYKKITVRMTLNHVSGMPGTEGNDSFGFRYDDKVKKETIDTLSREHLKHAPGAMAVYCNDGFTLAEMIVERVSGRRYIDFLNERIFRPLGLKNTGIGVGEIKGKPITLYYDPKTGKKHPPETLSVLGAGGLSSTALELCRFMDAFSAKGKLLKKASLAEMRKAQPSAFWGKLRNPTFSFGLGWDMTGLPRYDKAGIQILGKSGGTGNYSSMVFTVPDKRISVAVIATGTESGAMKITLDMLDAVLVEKGLVQKEERPVPVPPAAQKLPQGYASLSGYYADGMKLGQLVFDADKNIATLYIFKGQEKTPAVTLIYNNGYYHDAEGNRYYFADTGREVYFVNSPLHAGIDVIVTQKVKPIEKPHSLRTDMDGRVWLRRNVGPFEGVMSVESHFARSSAYKDLPGYVYFWGIKRIDSPEFAGMPFDAIRDQSELTLFEKDGTTWAWISDLLYSPAETAAALKAGENSVKIGSDGYNQWLVATEDMVVSLAKPEQGRIIMFTSDDVTTYDSALDTGDAYVAKGSYIEFAGFANGVFAVKARPVGADEKK